MTVASEENRSGPYTGNGVTTIFDYQFRIIDEKHIRVIRAANGIEETLTLGADYVVSGVGNPGGGSVAFVAAPTASQTITMLRNVPFTQETDLENQGPFYAETIEDALDLATMRDQQLAELASRTILVPASNPGYDPDQLINDIFNVKNDREYVAGARDEIAAMVSAALLKANNLSDVQSKAQSRLNLNIRQMEAIADATDLNTVVMSGSYYTNGANCTNTPAGNHYWYIEVFAFGAYVLQRATLYETAGATTYVRSCVAGSWGAWNQLGAASGSGGGYLTKALAQASSESSEFIRFLSQTGLETNRGEEWLGRKVAAAPTHSNYIKTASGTFYERVPAQPHTPASITELGCTPYIGASFDNSVPFNKILEYAQASGFLDWYVPQGSYHFNTRPNDIPANFNLIGAGNQRSWFYKNFPSSGTADGVLNIRQGQGVRVADMTLCGLAGSRIGASGSGCLISVVASLNYASGYTYIERCVLTGDTQVAASTAFPFYMDGTANPPWGGRDVFIRDCLFFGGEVGSMFLNGAVNVFWTGGGTYTAGGKSGRIYIGTQSGSFITQNVSMFLSQQLDGISVGNCSRINITSGSFVGNLDVTSGASITECIFVGPVSGTVANVLKTGTNRVINASSIPSA